MTCQQLGFNQLPASPGCGGETSTQLPISIAEPEAEEASQCGDWCAVVGATLRQGDEQCTWDGCMGCEGCAEGLAAGTEPTQPTETAQPKEPTEPAESDGGGYASEEVTGEAAVGEDDGEVAVAGDAAERAEAQEDERARGWEGTGEDEAANPTPNVGEWTGEEDGAVAVGEDEEEEADDESAFEEEAGDDDPTPCTDWGVPPCKEGEVPKGQAAPVGGEDGAEPNPNVGDDGAGRIEGEDYGSLHEDDPNPNPDPNVGEEEGDGSHHADGTLHTLTEAGRKGMCHKPGGWCVHDGATNVPSRSGGILTLSLTLTLTLTLTPTPTPTPTLSLLLTLTPTRCGGIPGHYCHDTSGQSGFFPCDKHIPATWGTGVQCLESSCACSSTCRFTLLLTLSILLTLTLTLALLLTPTLTLTPPLTLTLTSRDATLRSASGHCGQAVDEGAACTHERLFAPSQPGVGIVVLERNEVTITLNINPNPGPNPNPDPNPNPTLTPTPTPTPNRTRTQTTTPNRTRTRTTIPTLTPNPDP